MDLNGAWKSTCKVLLGGEIGDLAGYERYLLKYVEPVVEKKSCLSGNSTYLSSDQFSAGAHFISQNEIPKYQKRLADLRLGINEMKDIESIFSSISEAACYCGDVVLGNSHNVSDSSRIFNSTNVKSSLEIYDSKYVAYSSVARYAECLFGSNGIGETKFGIRNFNTYQNTRCFEANVIYNCSDCYFTATTGDCTHCFFCFNLRNRSYSIGNVALSKDKYFKLRDSLLEQIRTELERKKGIPGIIGFLENTGIARQPARKCKNSSTTMLDSKNPAQPISELNSAFADTTQLLFGKRLQPLLDYRKWLYRHVNPLIAVPSPKSGKAVHAEPLKYNIFAASNNVFVKLDESLALSESSIDACEVEKITYENASGKLDKISYFTPEAQVGTNINVVDCAAYGYAVNALECWWPVHTKNAAYCGWSRQSENTFGCSIIFSSKFCIKCYNSTNLTRCFEVSDSFSCSDCYFCHNKEGCDNAIFCFNAKSLRHAVCNREVGREKFLQIKKLLLGHINKQLDEKRGVGQSIFSLHQEK